MIIYSFIFALFFIGTNAWIVELDIAKGPILGKTGYTVGSKRFWYTFKGIPYAEPPTRFELAKEKERWEQPINCTFDKDECVQGSNPVTGSEDCLTLNVYTPSLSGNYPVLVWIHGGYFTAGNASYEQEAPDFIVEEGVVFVSIQYRLGIFGFMSTGDLDCPGNLGFKDQVLALQWVQENIKYFGGDPNNVTLGGQSAGAASVSLHIQSPKSKGLFSAAILNSGSSLCLWTLNRRSRETAFKVGISMGILALNTKDLINGLKKKDYVDIQKASEVVASLETLENPLDGIFYGYVSEPDHPDAFFTGKSEYQLSTGNFTRVPLLVGDTSLEASFFGNLTWYIKASLITYDFDVKKLTPADLTNNDKYKSLAGQAIHDKFFKGLVIGQEDALILEYASSDQFSRPMWQFGLDVSKYVDQTYFYKFSYMGSLGGIKNRTIAGVGHAEDLGYLFYRERDDVSKSDDLTRKRTVRLWTNFVKTHNPTPIYDPLLEKQIWLPMWNKTNNETHYFNLNSTLSIEFKPFDENLDFWNNDTDGVYTKWGQGIYDSY